MIPKSNRGGASGCRLCVLTPHDNQTLRILLCQEQSVNAMLSPVRERRRISADLLVPESLF